MHGSCRQDRLAGREGRDLGCGKLHGQKCLVGEVDLEEALVQMCLCRKRPELQQLSWGKDRIRSS